MLSLKQNQTKNYLLKIGFNDNKNIALSVSADSPNL